MICSLVITVFLNFLYQMMLRSLGRLVLLVNFARYVFSSLVFKFSSLLIKIGLCIYKIHFRFHDWRKEYVLYLNWDTRSVSFPNHQRNRLLHLIQISLSQVAAISMRSLTIYFKWIEEICHHLRCNIDILKINCCNSNKNSGTCDVTILYKGKLHRSM